MEVFRFIRKQINDIYCIYNNDDNLFMLYLKLQVRFFVKSIFDIAEKGNYEDVSVTMGFYLLIGIVAVCIASMFMYIYNNEAKKRFYRNKEEGIF